MRISTVRTEGLGDSTHILTHEGLGLVVDPQRDYDRFEGPLNEAGAELRYVLETHLHNDYLSGGRHLADRYDGELVVPAGAAPVYEHTPAFHNENISAGDLTIRPIHTPGHTPEHMSYLVLVDGEEVALFSGGSLLVGSAGRSDLLGIDRAETLARLQYISVNRLARLDGRVGLYPTHGAGSFCTSSGAGGHTSTIGEERRTNPVLTLPDVDAFVKDQLSGLVPYPAYYRYMGPANINGAEAIESLRISAVTETQFSELDPDVVVVDARPQDGFALGHIPGSIALELRDDFGVWAGWVIPYASPVVLIMNQDQNTEEAVRQLARIGFDDLRGVVTDLDSWDIELASYRTVDVDEFAIAVDGAAQVLDVRAPNEWEEGVITGSVQSYAPDVALVTPRGLDKGRPVWIACGTGYRANIAASALEPRGYQPVVLTGAGITDVLSSLSNRASDKGEAE